MHSTITPAAQAVGYKPAWLLSALSSIAAAWAVLHDVQWRAPWEKA